MIRYQQGNVSYQQRLHYFTWWVADNAKKGFVSERQSTKFPFTKVQKVNVDWMTTHSNNYPMLKANPSWISDIAKAEKSVNGQTVRYIPKGIIANTKAFRNSIKDGDIIGIVTNKKGLDTTHLGIAIWHKDGLHMLNASQVRGKVIEEPMLLRTYMAKHPVQVGIRVVEAR
jgi:hypothetical protein